MPIIRVFSDDSKDDTLGQRVPEHSAAALMAVMLENAARPVEMPSKKARRTKPEETLPGNPKGLTKKQHVFPARSIQRFVNQSGHVSVYNIARRKVHPARPGDILFCARRAWNQRAESGYMKHIEDRFQAIVDPVIHGQAVTITSEQKPAIDEMFALWYMRSRYRELDEQEYQLRGVAGDHLSKEYEENLEKNGYLFTRIGGRMPARQINGLQLQQRIDFYARDLSTLTGWGVIRPQSGEFIVPDIPSHTIIPLTPTLALIGSVADGAIVEQNLAEINCAIKSISQEYYFARDFSKCPV